MDGVTLQAVADFARRVPSEIIDITGGAPELHPDLARIIEDLAPLTNKVIVRSNLSALAAANTGRFIEAFVSRQVCVVASFPSLNEAQTESQRGKGIFQESIKALRLLNEAGYGREGTGLQLDLVSNPTGAFLPPSQKQAEERFATILRRKWGIEFNSLFTFANVPLGRFRRWLQQSGNLEQYMERLVTGFNPCAVDGLMCRSLISVAWDGYVYDCDFNLARGLPIGGHRTHISQMKDFPPPGTPIAVADHCYTCAAGSGFT
jgi:radical SAM/Cys-rich protein